MLIFVVLLLDLFFLLAVCWPIADINPYLVRDIQRTFQLLHGHWVLVGPDFNSGSYAPGPFFYFLLAPVVLFTQSPKWVILYALLFKWTTQIAFTRYFSKVFSVPFLYIFLAISSSTLLFHQFVWPNNASFIAPLFLVFLLLLHKYFWTAQANSKWTSAFMGLLVGLLIQVHFSFVVLIPFLLQIIYQRRHNQKWLQATALLFSGILFACLPYLVALFNEQKLAIFYFADLGLGSFAEEWVRQILRGPLVLNNLTVYNLESLFLIAFVLGRALYVLITQPRPFKKVDTFIFTLSIVVLLLSPWILADRSTRYFSIAFCATLLLLVRDLYNLSTTRSKTTWVPWIFVSVFALSGRFIYFNKFQDLGLQGNCEVCVQQANSLCEFFNKEGISYPQMVLNTYELFGPENENSLALLKGCFQIQKSQGTSLDRRFLLELRHDSQELNAQSLSAAIGSMPKELGSLFQKNALKIELERPGFRLYSIKNFTPPPIEAGNLTQTYEIDPGVGTRAMDFAPTLSTFPDNKRYRTRICDAPLFCEIFFYIGVMDDQFQIEVKSRILQTKFKLSPINGRIQGLRLNYLCDNEPQSTELVSSVGVTDGPEQNRTFFTPLVYKLDQDCQSFRPLNISAESVDIVFVDRKRETLTEASFSLEEF